MSRVLITGAKGMLGRTLLRRFIAHQVWGVDMDVDIADAAAVEAEWSAWKPEVVVHCAAMTAVDACETERDKAYRINAVGSANVAIACQRHRARLIAISTDYVFSGDLDRPYHEYDAPAPRTVYGASKLAGEDVVRTHCPDHVVARIAWLYGPGGPSFVHAMLKHGAQEGAPMKVVDDQIGNPTSTDAVADGLLAIIGRPICGTVHLTCEGDASWYAFTREIFTAKGFTRGLLPCTTAEFPRPAPRPMNSRLDKMALRLHGLPAMPHWRDTLARFFAAYPEG
ncbi:MAG: dTDP-4-dehydrorhamnose reductase [Planctomycetes bacterium]|nr:dTDP-4-dehydrorhamnose reductase [Planctomycetota bacterium]